MSAQSTLSARSDQDGVCRSKWKTLLPSAVALCLLGSVSVLNAAMFHRPATGQMKDNHVIWHDGSFYMFSMYKPDGGDWNHVWLARSRDGVHWEDVGAVIQNAPWPVWAMRVWKAGNQFVLDHGSFSDGQQNVLRFWRSTDLIHWQYLGPSFDVRRPDGGRLDHMDVISWDEGGKTEWYGYACGGILRSEDGVRWKWSSDFNVTDPVRGAYPLGPHVNGFGETGGCQRIDGRFYLLTGGAFPGDLNYAVATYLADNPLGPFRPDYPAFRFCGNSGRKLVLVWAHFCRGFDPLLIANYVYDLAHDNYCMPSLKRAVVDPQGHLHMGYWSGNEAVKGPEIAIDWASCRAECPETISGLATNKDGLRMTARPRPNVGWLTAAEPVYALALGDSRLDVDRGFVLEGSLRIDGPGRQCTGGIGLCFEEESQRGTALFLHSWGLTEIGKFTWAGTPRFTSEDRTGYGSATVAGIAEGQTCSFRLLLRQNLFEFYLNDRLVQIFSTEHATGRVGLVVHDGTANFSNLRAWSMNFTPPTAIRPNGQSHSPNRAVRP